MRKVATSLLLLVASSSAALGMDGCPPREKGSAPWSTAEILPGDKWAWVFLDIDTDGKPVACRIGKNNMTAGLRSTVCRSFVRNWVAVPVIVDGKPVKTTIKRHFIAMGDKHVKAEKEARKRYFAENPAERPECYRD